MKNIISLRDYFAGQILSGLLAKGCDTDFAIKEAYKIADKMLELSKVKTIK